MQLILVPCKYGLKANHDDHNEGVTKKISNWQIGTCVSNLCTFISRLWQNSNVISTKFAWSGYGNPNGTLHGFLTLYYG